MIVKYKNNQSIIANKNVRNGPDFIFVSINDAIKEIKRLKARKATQIADIPVKI